MRIHLRLTGRTGLIFHNPRLADKQDPFTKAIAEVTDKRKKTDDDEAEIAKLQWYGGIYFEPDIGVYVPTYAILRSFERGGVPTREGSTVIRSVAMTTDRVPLVYSGPRDLDGLWAREEFRHRALVGVKQSKVVRTRPIFRQWSLDVELELLTSIMNLDNFIRVTETAGLAEGLLDARKLGYGRYNCEDMTASMRVAA